MVVARPKLGLALSGGGHRAAFFHIGVLAKLAELGLLRPIEVISTVSGGSIVGALYYLHVKNLLETKADGNITDVDYVELVRTVEREYREAAQTNVRGSAWSSPGRNFRMALPSYTRTDRVGELYEQRFYAKAWGTRDRRDGRIAMRDLLIHPKGHVGAFDPDVENATRNAPVPILLLESTTLNTGHNWRFEAMYMGEPPRQESTDEQLRADVDKNEILARTKWDDLPQHCQNFPLGAAVASSACFPGGFPPMRIPKLFGDLTVELVDGGVHDNQGIEGLADRGCEYIMISDASGQMPDVVRPSTRLPAVLGRVVSIYGDAEREQRLLDVLGKDDTRRRFVHLQTGLPAKTRTPDGKETRMDAELTTTDFGVDERVQQALANIRTDLDAFCDTEAWALMADAHKLVGRIVPGSDLATLGTPVGSTGWRFDPVAHQLASPDEHFLRLLRVSKERFLKPARMTSYGIPVAVGAVVAGAGAIVYGLWRALEPHGTLQFTLGLALSAAIVVYALSQRPLAKQVAVVVFDVVVPALLALPLLVVGWTQILAGRRWLALGRVVEHARAPERGEATGPV